jgi:hypothetical protein
MPLVPRHPPERDAVAESDPPFESWSWAFEEFPSSHKTSQQQMLLLDIKKLVYTNGAVYSIIFLTSSILSQYTLSLR